MFRNVSQDHWQRTLGALSWACTADIGTCGGLQNRGSHLSSRAFRIRGFTTYAELTPH